MSIPALTTRLHWHISPVQQTSRYWASSAPTAPPNTVFGLTWNGWAPERSGITWFDTSLLGGLVHSRRWRAFQFTDGLGGFQSGCWLSRRCLVCPIRVNRTSGSPIRHLCVRFCRIGYSEHHEHRLCVRFRNRNPGTPAHSFYVSDSRGRLISVGGYDVHDPHANPAADSHTSFTTCDGAAHSPALPGRCAIHRRYGP